MRSGNLDRRITVQRKMSSASPSGEPVETWDTVALRRSASMLPVRTEERFSSPEKVAAEQIEFRVRWSIDLAELSPLDRVIYPALTEVQDADPSYVVPERSIHDVLGVLEVGRREGLRIITTRRPDVVA